MNKGCGHGGGGFDLNIKYFDPEMPRLEKTEKGDFIDLYVRTIHVPTSEQAVVRESTDAWLTSWIIHADTFFLIKLGVAMQLPSGYEAWLTPRSSTFKKKRLLLTNSPGIIDNSYCGDNDEWMAAVYACQRTTLVQYDKLFQFRIVESQPSLNFVEVDSLNNTDRGGFGSTD